MKKNTFIIMIAVAAIAVLGGAIALVLSLGGDNTPQTTSSSAILLYDKTGVRAEEIYITTENEAYSFLGYSYADEAEQASRAKEEESSEQSSDVSEGNYRTDTGFSSDDIKMHYTLQEHPDVDLDKSRMNDLAYQCSYLTAVKIVDKSGSRYADFGLDKPFSTVRVIFSDNSSETIMIGNDAPDGQGVYFRREKSPNVYLAVDSTIGCLYQNMLFFVDRQITGELYYEPDSAEGTTVESIRLSGTFYGEELLFDNKGTIKYPLKYMMQEPRIEIAEANYVDTFGKAFYEMTAQSVAAVDPDKETVAKFGLDKPYMDVTVKSTDESEIHLLCTEADSDGMLHIMNSGGNVIYSMPKDGAENWYEVSEMELLSVRMIYPDLTAMTSLDITCGKTKAHLDVKNTVEENDQMQEITYTDITYNGKSLEYSNLYDYLYALSEMYRLEPCDIDVSGLTPEYTAVFAYEKDGQTDGDTYSIYKDKDGKCFAVLNGHTEAYVSNGYFENFLPQLERLLAGESIEYVEYPDETSGKESSTGSADGSSTDSSEESAKESSQETQAE